MIAKMHQTECPKHGTPLQEPDHIVACRISADDLSGEQLDSQLPSSSTTNSSHAVDSFTITNSAASIMPSLGMCTSLNSTNHSNIRSDDGALTQHLTYPDWSCVLSYTNIGLVAASSSSDCQPKSSSACGSDVNLAHQQRDAEHIRLGEFGMYAGV